MHREGLHRERFVGGSSSTGRSASTRGERERFVGGSASTGRSASTRRERERFVRGSAQEREHKEGARAVCFVKTKFKKKFTHCWSQLLVSVQEVLFSTCIV